MMARLKSLVAVAWLASISPVLSQDRPAQPTAQPTAQPVAQPEAEKELALNAREIPLGGALRTPALWHDYKARFISQAGRVIDTGNGMISHSEGQGYAMLFAVAANDRETFDRLWGWTRANLMVRDDQLIAWRWEPGQRPAIADMNNATDGDILVAWALAEAAEHWAELSYRISGRRIAVEIGRKTVLFKTANGALLLPAVQGFSAQDRQDGPVINLSYYVFPAFARLKIVAAEYDWPGLIQTGLDLLKSAAENGSRLPPDWMSVRERQVRPADGFAPYFAYNAIRVPLYMAWAGIGEREHYREFFRWAKNRNGALPIVDVTTGRETDSFREPGYAAIADVLECVNAEAKAGQSLSQQRAPQNYYPATLHMMSVLAVQMRYPSCNRI